MQMLPPRPLIAAVTAVVRHLNFRFVLLRHLHLEDLPNALVHSVTPWDDSCPLCLNIQCYNACAISALVPQCEGDVLHSILQAAADELPRLIYFHSG